MLQSSLLQFLHRKLVKYQEQVRILFLMSYTTLLLLLLIAVFAFTQMPKDYGRMMEFGAQLGVFALLSYSLTLLPGIFQRLRVFPELVPSLMLFRRQFGVLMFLSAFVHGGILFSIPMLFSGGFNPSALTSHIVMGNTALLVLLPLWLTSNSWSVRRLGRNWKVLHRLTYVALFFIFLHVALSVELGWAVLTLALLAAEVVSWIAVWRRPPGRV